MAAESQEEQQQIELGKTVEYTLLIDGRQCPLETGEYTIRIGERGFYKNLITGNIIKIREFSEYEGILISRENEDADEKTQRYLRNWLSETKDEPEELGLLQSVGGTPQAIIERELFDTEELSKRKGWV